MVEGERQAPVAGIEDDGRSGVVGALGKAFGPGQEDRRDGVVPGVPRRVGIGAQLAEEIDVERGLLASLPDGGRLERLAVFDEATGQGPARRGVPPLDEDDAAAPSAVGDLDDDIDGRQRIAKLGAGHRQDRPFAVIVGGAFGLCQTLGSSPDSVKSLRGEFPRCLEREAGEGAMNRAK